MNTNEAGALYGIPAPLIASACGVSVRTATRWKAKRRAPAWATRAVRLLVDCELAPVSADWQGWRIAGGELVSPEGERFAPGDVRAIPWRRAQLAELERAAREPRQFRLI